ncbi:hypothetical protein F5Y05DRAFT_393900 [Hypoxylon sp. FL0543]|nr:hypothetical protein F5Y05DRAFT_393900 [Hypoxylon sp. FL0543]
MGERTGSRVFQILWSYVIVYAFSLTYNRNIHSGGRFISRASGRLHHWEVLSRTCPTYRENLRIATRATFSPEMPSSLWHIPVSRRTYPYSTARTNPGRPQHNECDSEARYRYFV